MIKKLTLILFITVFQFIQAQENYNVFSIPEDLKKNANAVIRLSETNVSVNSIKDLIVSQTRIVTVLNKRGDKHVNAYLHYSNSISIKKISAIVYNGFGKVIEKYKKSDFEDRSSVSNGTMYSDSRVKYLNYIPKEYPYTVRFTSSYKTSTTAFIQPWFPVQGYNVSVEKSKYLFATVNIGFRNKLYNTNELINIDVKEDKYSLVGEVLNQHAINYEEDAPSFDLFMPYLKIALDEFTLYGKKGIAKDWKTFGKWQYENLLFGRDELDSEVVNRVSKLISNISKPADKAKAIYEYVQDNTRYISVQLGIGGLQPDFAKNVDKLKYGDCKGLTNYTKSLLKSQGIEAYYAEVFSGYVKRNIDKKFTSFQGDHVILCIPKEEGYTWLECTNQFAPYGYIGGFTDDRDVLIMKPDGGEIVHTTKYGVDDSKQELNVSIELNTHGGLMSELTKTTTGVQYGQRYHLQNVSKERQIEEYLNRWGYLNGIKVIENSYKNDKSKVMFQESLKIEVSNYATKVGEKLLVPLNPFNRVEQSPMKYQDRKLPFHIMRSFKDVDINVFKLPNGFVLDGIPKNYEITNEFGKYIIQIEKTEENKIKVTREYMLNEGVFPKEKYNEYRIFQKKIVRKDKSKFVLIIQA
jgi:hypothetical protein